MSHGRNIPEINHDIGITNYFLRCHALRRISAASSFRAVKMFSMPVVSTELSAAKSVTPFIVMVLPSFLDGNITEKSK
jgi:hypothetical protein